MRFIKKRKKTGRLFIPWRFILTALIIIAQIALSLALVAWLSEAYIYTGLFFVIIEIVMLAFIVDKDEPASYKLAWGIVFALFPIAGIVIYGMFGREKRDPFKRLNKTYLNSDGHSLSPEQEDESMLKKFDEVCPMGFSLSRYLKNTSLLPVYTSTRTRYLPSGEIFIDRLKADISHAEKYVFLEFFIIGEGEMWADLYRILLNKAKAGVSVYVLYDDIGSMKKLPADFDVKLRRDGIFCYKFNPFLPFISAFHNNRDHRKIAVIDGKIAFTGGINLSDEYVNLESPFGHWKDSGIRLEGAAVDNFVYMFTELYNPFANAPLLATDFYAEHETEFSDGFVQPFGDGPKPFYDNYIGQSLFLTIINSAKKYLYITTPYLIVDYYLLDAIAVAAKRGVDVRIMTPHHPDKKYIFIMTRSNYMHLIKAGVKIYEYEPGFIHSKTLVCDNSIGFSGTINFDYRSFVHHFECGVLLCQTSSLRDIKADFLLTSAEKGILQTQKTAKLSFFERITKIVTGIFSPLL